MNRLKAMTAGGAILGRVREALLAFTQVGVTPRQIEAEAMRLIRAEGAEPSFTRVPGYRWATCVNLNEGIVHGIPESDQPLVSGDLVTVDVGVYYQGFHTDAAYSLVVGEATPEQTRFLAAGMVTLQRTIEGVRPGVRVGELSRLTQETLAEYGVYASPELTGHGVGRELHEEPMIPNLVTSPIEKSPQLTVGQTIAIEIIYASKPIKLYLEKDGWTISVKNDKLSAVFEETVLVTQDGYSILTKPTLFQIIPSGTIQP